MVVGRCRRRVEHAANPRASRTLVLSATGETDEEGPAEGLLDVRSLRRCVPDPGLQQVVVKTLPRRRTRPATRSARLPAAPVPERPAAGAPGPCSASVVHRRCRRSLIRSHPVAGPPDHSDVPGCGRVVPSLRRRLIDVDVDQKLVPDPGVAVSLEVASDHRRHRHVVLDHQCRASRADRSRRPQASGRSRCGRRLVCLFVGPVVIVAGLGPQVDADVSADEFSSANLHTIAMR